MKTRHVATIVGFTYIECWWNKCTKKLTAKIPFRDTTVCASVPYLNVDEWSKFIDDNLDNIINHCEHVIRQKLYERSTVAGKVDEYILEMERMLNAAHEATTSKLMPPFACLHYRPNIQPYIKESI